MATRGRAPVRLMWPLRRQLEGRRLVSGTPKQRSYLRVPFSEIGSFRASQKGIIGSRFIAEHLGTQRIAHELLCSTGVPSRRTDGMPWHPLLQVLGAIQIATMLDPARRTRLGRNESQDFDLLNQFQPSKASRAIATIGACSRSPESS